MFVAPMQVDISDLTPGFYLIQIKDSRHAKTYKIQKL